MVQRFATYPQPTAEHPLEHRPFPEVAAALRSHAAEILEVWLDEVQRTLPEVRRLTPAQLRDHLPSILEQMAAALEDGGSGADGLVREAPSQGLTRFQQNYNVRELMAEDRLLRRIIIEQVVAELGRLLSLEEQVALAMAIDTMLQESVVAFIQQQNAQLRAGAEAEVKYLSFLSHDLNNNLGSVTMWLDVLRSALTQSPGFDEAIETVDAAQQAIASTIAGMGQLLQTERLRRRGGVDAPKPAPVKLAALVSRLVRQFSIEAQRKGVQISAEVPPDAVVHSDAELIALALQNLIGNAIKYSARGTIRIRGHRDRADPRRWVLAVSDQGPGIAPEHLERIFAAFNRGETHGQAGLGLGLTIAAQAAKLLQAELRVESQVGVGSRFSLILPGHVAESQN